MGDAEVKAAKWRLVQVGRVVLLEKGLHAGKLAAIIEIIDHKRALIDGPTPEGVPRQSIALANIVLTPLVIESLPRGVRRGALKKEWEKAEIDEKWGKSAWAQKRDQRTKRKGLSDFDKFKVTRLRKQARFEVRKSFAKIRSAK